jgi:PP-loop superfamily ATP-utilizing enzyme
MSGSPPGDARVEGARRLLESQGVAGARVSAAGPDGEIAVVTVPAARWRLLLEDEGPRIVEAVKAQGFRYVALDLDPSPAGG